MLLNFGIIYLLPPTQNSMWPLLGIWDIIKNVLHVNGLVLLCCTHSEWYLSPTISSLIDICCFRINASFEYRNFRIGADFLLVLGYELFATISVLFLWFWQNSHENIKIVTICSYQTTTVLHSTMNRMMGFWFLKTSSIKTFRKPTEPQINPDAKF